MFLFLIYTLYISYKSFGRENIYKVRIKYIHIMSLVKRKIQQLGSSLCVTLPATWVAEKDVHKGDELSFTLLDDGNLKISKDK